jgi:peptidoglycan-N-acetylmuramic acid deacetylase
MPKSDSVTRVHKRIAALLAASLLLSISVLPASAAGTGWYCVRGKNHAQPPADPALREVEKHGGLYIDHVHTAPDAEEKVIYLTFDAGYENGNVALVLDALRDEGAVGAFFILGNLPDRYPELVRRMAEEGHLVCNHTYSHRNLCGAPAGELTAELKRLEDACSAIGVEVAGYYRPPEGCFDVPMLEEAARAGYRTVFWSFAYADWDNERQPDPAAARRKILDNLHNGEVMLLHPTSATNATILRDILRELKARGYRFGTLGELAGGEGS